MRVVLDAVRHIVRVLRVSSRAAEKSVGLSGAQLFVLQKLAQMSAMSVGELAEATFTHQSSVSVVVSRLVERRLVVRKRSPTDRRRAEVALTSAGRALLRRAPGAAQELLVEALVRLDRVERRQLGETLQRLVRGLGVGEKAAVMFFEKEEKGR